MVIKPYHDFHDSGIEFSLTYFDDPGINIPSAVTTWVAISGLPDYLCRMRDAGRNYKNYIESKKAITLNDKNASIDHATQDSSDLNLNHLETENPPKSKSPQSNPSSGKDKGGSQGESDEVGLDVDSPEESRGFLDYFFFMKLFA